MRLRRRTDRLSGDLLVDGVRRSVQVEGDFTSIEELENVIIKAESGFIVHLRDVADVSFVEKERESYAREYSRPVVSLDVVKRAGGEPLGSLFRHQRHHRRSQAGCLAQ